MQARHHIAIRMSGKMNLNAHNVRIVTIGGTFDTLHIGHKEYIRLALEFSENVWIYVSSDDYAGEQKKYCVRPYNDRVEELKDFLTQNVIYQHYQIRCLNRLEELQRDYLEAPELARGAYMAIVSPEYYDFFQTLNALREMRGLKSFLTLVKRRTLTAELRDLSSYEVRKRLPINGNTLAMEKFCEQFLALRG